jgi:hypothetical protein
MSLQHAKTTAIAQPKLSMTEKRRGNVKYVARYKLFWFSESTSFTTKGTHHTLYYNIIYLFNDLFIRSFIYKLYNADRKFVSVSYRMVSEYGIAKDVECSGCESILNNILAFAWRDRENPETPSAKKIGLGSET